MLLQLDRARVYTLPQIDQGKVCGRSSRPASPAQTKWTAQYTAYKLPFELDVLAAVYEAGSLSLPWVHS